MVEPVFWPRLRWRMRGAWQWPAFGALTVVDAVLVTSLPFQGDGPDTAGALLLAGFFNLVAVAVAAPFTGMLVRRARPDLPRLIARDYAGTALLAVVTLGILAGGLIHRDGLRREHEARAAALLAAHQYVVSSAPHFRVGLAVPDVRRLETDSYRVCVSGPGKLPLCLLVNTTQRPAGIVRDHDRTPNPPG
jgi:hypothetical protein